MLSLRDSTLSDITTIPCDYAFPCLFQGCSNLLTAPVLSATILKPQCYGIRIDTIQTIITFKYGLFSNCSSLVIAPELPATTLAKDCYGEYDYFDQKNGGMFSRCMSLVEAPELPATVLADGCYACMFFSCPLVSTPKLLATTLADNCYRRMFSSCKKLTRITTLPAVTISEYAYYEMFAYSNITASTTQTAECQYMYRIPESETGEGDSKAFFSIFTNATEPFSPSINTTFYISVPSF